VRRQGVGVGGLGRRIICSLTYTFSSRVSCSLLELWVYCSLIFLANGVYLARGLQERRDLNAISG